MATSPPVGNPIVWPSTLYATWEPGGASVLYNAGYCVVAADSANQLWRTAIKFGGTNPIWAETWAEHGGIIFYVSRAVAEFDLSGTAVNVWVRPLTTAWDDTYSVAQMNTVWAAAGGSLRAVSVNQPGWYYLPINDVTGNLGILDDIIEYGAGLSVLPASLVGSAVIPTAYGLQPQCRVFYGLEWPCIDNGYPSNPATGYDVYNDRGNLSDALKSQLNRDCPQWQAELELTAKLRKKSQALSDLEISDDVSIASVGDWASQEIGLPETWALRESNPGGLTLRYSGDIDPDDLEGGELEMAFYLRNGLGTREQVSGAITRVVRAGRRLGGILDVALEDLHASLRDASTHRIMPLQGDYLEYEDDQTLRIVWDLVINSVRRIRTGALDYQVEEEPGVYRGDWYMLFNRFVGTWPLLTVSTAEAEATSAQALQELVARSYGLFIGSGHDGRAHVFHPAVYRRSMRVWRINIDEQAAQGRVIVKRKTPSASVLTTDDPDQEVMVYGRTPLSNVELGHKVEDVELPDDYWVDSITVMIRYAILQQLSTRYCDAPDELTLVTGHQALPYSAGDQLLVTSEVYGLDDTPFLVTGREGGPTDSEIMITGYHWPYWPGAHSLFEQNTPRGIWRWCDEDHALDYTNRAWGENAESGVTWAFSGAGDPPELMHEGWLAPLVKVTTSAEGAHAELRTTSAISPTGTGATNPKSDVLEVHYAVKYTPNFTVDDARQDWWFCYWRDSSGTKALVMFIHRLDWPPPPDPLAEKSQYGLGFTNDITADPIVWQWSILAPPGVGSRGSVAGGWPNDYIAAVLEEGTAHLYINGDDVGSESWTRDTDLDQIKVRCSGDSRTAFGCLRLLRTPGLPDRDELAQLNGMDPYYP